MKQGSGHSTNSAGKPSTKTHAVDPGRADQIGQSVAFTKGPLYEGRGLEAPKAKSTSHPSGSQGKH